MNYKLFFKRCAIGFISISLLLSVIIFIRDGIDTGASPAGTHYYISSSLGDDGNHGQSPDAPWETFDNLRNKPLVAGDKVLLRRGDTWNTRLTILGKGSEADPIYVGPYGIVDDPAPIISLTNHRDDIAIVVQDFDQNSQYIPMGHIHIDNLIIENTRMGIYFRNATSNTADGFKVTNMEFRNITQEEVIHNVSRKFIGQDLNSNNNFTRVGFAEDNVSIWSPVGGGDSFEYRPDSSTGKFSTSIPYNGLAFFDGQADYEVMVRKGDLDLPGSSAMGGDTEYVFPSAIWFGGRRSELEEKIGFRNIDISNIILEDVFFGIGGDFIYNPSNDRKFFQNIRVTDVTMNRGQTIFGFTNVDYGNPQLNPNNDWGVFRNLNIIAGRDDFLFAGGTTGGFAERASNGYFEYCNFSNVQNGGIEKPAGYDYTADGCGFDFEGDTSNIIITNSIFANNTGQGVLMMKGPRDPNSNITLSNNLFYNNLISAMDSNNYRWDITVWNTDNTDILFDNNRHVHREKTDGGVRPNLFINDSSSDPNNPSGNYRGHGNRTQGITETNPSFKLQNNPTQNDFMTEVNNKGLSAALGTVSLEQNAFTPIEPTATPIPPTPTPVPGTLFDITETNSWPMQFPAWGGSWSWVDETTYRSEGEWAYSQFDNNFHIDNQQTYRVRYTTDFTGPGMNAGFWLNSSNYQLMAGEYGITIQKFGDWTWLGAEPWNLISWAELGITPSIGDPLTFDIFFTPTSITSSVNDVKIASHEGTVEGVFLFYTHPGASAAEFYNMQYSVPSPGTTPTPAPTATPTPEPTDPDPEPTDPDPEADSAVLEGNWFAQAGSTWEINPDGSITGKRGEDNPQFVIACGNPVSAPLTSSFTFDAQVRVDNPDNDGNATVVLNNSIPSSHWVSGLGDIAFAFGSDRVTAWIHDGAAVTRVGRYVNDPEDPNHYGSLYYTDGRYNRLRVEIILVGEQLQMSAWINGYNFIEDGEYFELPFNFVESRFHTIGGTQDGADEFTATFRNVVITQNEITTYNWMAKMPVKVAEADTEGKFLVTVNDINPNFLYQVWAYERIETTIFDDMIFNHDNWMLLKEYTLGSDFEIVDGVGTIEVDEFDAVDGNYTIAIRVKDTNDNFLMVTKDSLTSQELGFTKISRVLIDGKINFDSVELKAINDGAIEIEVFANLPDVAYSASVKPNVPIDGPIGRRFSWDISNLKPGRYVLALTATNGESSDTVDIVFELYDPEFVFAEINELQVSWSVVETEPTEPDPTEPDPTEPDPTEPDPTEPDPTEPDPTEPDPIGKLKVVLEPQFQNADGTTILYRISEPGRRVIISREIPITNASEINDYTLAADQFGIYNVSVRVLLDGVVHDGISSTLIHERPGGDKELDITIPPEIHVGIEQSIVATATIPGVAAEDIEYSFWRTDARGDVLVRDYGSNTWNWTPARVGEYSIQVRAKGPGAGSYEVTDNVVVEVIDPDGVDQKAIVSAIEINEDYLNNNATERTPILIEADAISDSETLMYKFIITNGFAFGVETNYSLSPNYKWVPGKPGDYTVRVMVKNDRSYGRWDFRETFQINVSSRD